MYVGRSTALNIEQENVQMCDVSLVIKVNITSVSKSVREISASLAAQTDGYI